MIVRLKIAYVLTTAILLNFVVQIEIRSLNILTNLFAKKNDLCEKQVKKLVVLKT